MTRIKTVRERTSVPSQLAGIVAATKATYIRFRTSPGTLTRPDELLFDP